LRHCCVIDTSLTQKRRHSARKLSDLDPNRPEDPLIEHQNCQSALDEDLENSFYSGYVLPSKKPLMRAILMIKKEFAMRAMALTLMQAYILFVLSCTQVYEEGCEPQDARGVGPCEMGLGSFWDGEKCVSIEGCECAGEDCDELASVEGCRFNHAHCLGSAQNKPPARDSVCVRVYFALL
jgi:hypothetical protein